MGLSYQGSKRRLMPALQSIARERSRDCRFYVEPFLGGANSIAANVYGLPMILSDAHGELIALYTALRDGWEPPAVITRSEYEAARRRDPDLPTHVIAWRLLAASAKSRYDTSWAKDPRRNGDLIAPYSKPQAEAARKLGLALKGAELHALSYERLKIPSGSYVYCDPPYKGTAEYKVSGFDSEAFYEWAEKTASEFGRTVIVSEYQAPDHWPVIHRQELLATIGKSNNAKRLEKVFLVRARRRFISHG